MYYFEIYSSGLGGKQMQCPTENELDYIGKQQKCEKNRSLK